MEDNYVPRGTPNRALKTLPDHMLKIRESPIDGLGVFAKKMIPARVRFGPYKGVRISLDDSRRGSGYAFEVGLYSLFLKVYDRS